MRTFRVTSRDGRWHVAFAVVPGPIDASGTGEAIGIAGGVKITAALSGGRKPNRPQLTARARAQLRRHRRRAARVSKNGGRKQVERP